MRLFHVDAFTDEMFRGNPAAVVLLDRPREDSFLRDVAAEMNLAETAFVNLSADEIGLRWFTPKTEVDLCGHATLASAMVLWRTGLRRGALRFRTASGVLSATPFGEGVELDFPALQPVKTALLPGLTEALGATPVAVHSSRFDLCVELSSPEEVQLLAPDFAALARLPVRGVIVTASSPAAEMDFVSRFFAPSAGIDEDPVTGSAHCVLAPYWATRLGRNELVGFQASARGGFVKVELRGERVRLRGDAVIVAAGELYPPDERFSSAGGWES